MREGVGYIGQMLLQQFAHAPFVNRIDDRPKQTHGDRFDLRLFQLGDDFGHRFLVEGLARGTIKFDALGNLIGQRARHIGLGIGRGEIEGLDAPAFSKDQNIGMSIGGEKGCARGVSCDDGVDRMGRAVDQHIALGQ